MSITATASPPSHIVPWTCPRCGWNSPNEAVAFLLESLSPGPRAVREIVAAAEAHGIAQSRLKAAKKMLRVQFFRVGGHPGTWHWRLP
jgi:hypothetical protein